MPALPPSVSDDLAGAVWCKYNGASWHGEVGAGGLSVLRLVLLPSCPSSSSSCAAASGGGWPSRAGSCSRTAATRTPSTCCRPARPPSSESSTPRPLMAGTSSSICRSPHPSFMPWHDYGECAVADKGARCEPRQLRTGSTPKGENGGGEELCTPHERGGPSGRGSPGGLCTPHEGGGPSGRGSPHSFLDIRIFT